MGNTLAAVKRQLLQEGLQQPLAQVWSEHPRKLQWDEAMQDMRSCAGFGVRSSDGGSGYLRFEFERAGLNGLFWWIRRSEVLKSGETEHPLAQELRTTLEKSFGRGGTSPHWFWYSTDLRAISQAAHTVPRDWQQAESPWLSMNCGALHCVFVDFADQVMGLLESGRTRHIFQGMTRAIA